MTFSLLLIGIVLSILGALATLILCIVALATGKQRNGLIYGVVFMMSVIFAVLSIMEVAKRGAGKVRQGVEWIKKMDKNNNSWDKYSETDNYYGYVLRENHDTVPAGYYEDCPHKVTDSVFQRSEVENDCILLIYPYRIVPTHSLKTGALEKYKSKLDSSAKEIIYIDEFAFDTLYLLARRGNKEMSDVTGKGKDMPDYTYFLFDFKTGHCETFMNENRLWEEANKRGYTGKKYFSSVFTHYYATGHSGDEED